MSGLITSVTYQLGLGALGGFIVGFAVKKLLKLVILIVGLLIVLLLYLGFSGVIVIHYDQLADATRNALGFFGQVADWLTPIISHLPFAGSFIIGFLIGFKIG